MTASRLPHFIIGGAMKSGTSSLHHLLAALPGVFIPDAEVFFFDIDDFEQHPDFFVGPNGEWQVPAYERDFEAYRAWYASFFADAPSGAIIGEDSTTYLAARRAPQRINALLPDVRMVFLLRDPADRTYSHYWHLVRSGRATRRFEAMLRHDPGTLVQRSRYLEQARRYLATFPPERLLFLLFEELVAHPLAVLGRVTRFLDLPAPDALPTSPHRNPARVPRSLRLQLIRNRLLERRAARRFAAPLPGTGGRRSASRAAGRQPGRLALRVGRPPPMAPETRRALNELFAAENAGLDTLLGLDLDRHWYRAR